MELIRSERCWEDIGASSQRIIGIKTYVETEVKTSNGDKFVIKIHEDGKYIRCEVENEKGQLINRTR